ncbi:hypothetical protein [Paraburkholderia sp. DGU8]|jgi:hypothetical protein|uniref:hypothetical protein n=1 Tax=Paraburkholderia sp. DGU8 TaxID=3161997 RepID=UPI0034663C67
MADDPSDAGLSAMTGVRPEAAIRLAKARAAEMGRSEANANVNVSAYLPEGLGTMEAVAFIEAPSVGHGMAR